MKKSSWVVAIWQFLIDHSTVEPDGNLRVFFRVKDIEQFKYRVMARKNGSFKRTNAQRIEAQQQLKITDKIAGDYYKSLEKHFRNIRDGKDVKKRILLYLHIKTGELLKINGGK